MSWKWHRSISHRYKSKNYDAYSFSFFSIYLQGISAKTKCLIETYDKEFIVSTNFKVEIQKEHFSLKWTSSFLLCSFNFKIRSKFKQVYLINKDNEPKKTEGLPKLRIHYPEKDAKETSSRQEIEKMAVCVKPFHLKFNRALWVSFKVVRSFWSQACEAVLKIALIKLKKEHWVSKTYKFL